MCTSARWRVKGRFPLHWSSRTPTAADTGLLLGAALAVCRTAAVLSGSERNRCSAVPWGRLGGYSAVRRKHARRRDHMRRAASEAPAKPWWDDFPKTDRQPEPKQEFCTLTLAHDLALVCFVWRMTGDDRYASVRERAVTWAGYPPGGRSSPQQGVGLPDVSLSGAAGRRDPARRAAR